MFSTVLNLNFLHKALIALLLLNPVLLIAQEDRAGADEGLNSDSEIAEKEPRRVKRLGDSSTADWEIDLSMPAGPVGQGQGSDYDLPDAEQNARLQSLLSSLATTPGNQEAMASLDKLLSEILEQAGEQARLGQPDEMQQLLSVVRSVNPQQAGLAEASRKLQGLRNVDDWLVAASQAMEADKIIDPVNGNAMHFLEQVLAVDPENQFAHASLLRAQRILIERALKAAQELDFELAEEWLYEASIVRQPQDLVIEASQQIDGYQLRQIDTFEQDILSAIEAGNYAAAEFVMIDLIALIGNDQRVQTLRTRLNYAKRYGLYSPGEIIQDALKDEQDTAPAVVVIKAGSFLMGSTDRESGRSENEGPQHRVTLRRGFALGLHEVTVGQFRLFTKSKRHRTQAETVGSSKVYDEKSGRITDRQGVSWKHDYEGRPARDNDPVIHVDWYDAQAYADWLTEQTGFQYRLPTEAEYEYAIRAGSMTRYWWGDGSPGDPLENLTGTEDESASGRHWTAGFRRYEDGYWGPAPAASFVPNSLGIFDLAGNVSEWVEDCWHPTYSQAPLDGSAWVNPGCERRVVRGGYWASSKDQARSAARISAGAGLHGPRVGIRIARDL